MRLQKAKQLLAVHADAAVIFGSAAIVLRGVGLDREPADLDLFVSEAVFDRLAQDFQVRTKAAGEGGIVRYLRPADGIEVLESFPGVEYDEIRKHAEIIDHSEGLLVGSLSDLRLWKITQNRHPKDPADVEAIDKFLSGR